MTTGEQSASTDALGLGADFTANRSDLTADLVGRTLVLVSSGGERAGYAFADARRLSWDEPQGRRTGLYEALKVTDAGRPR